MRRRELALASQVGSLRALLEQHASSGFQDVERMFIELRAADDPQQLDVALREAAGEFEDLDPATSERLRALYERLGLLQHHEWVLREAPDWRSRADSALLLGHLGVVAAIPALAAAVRDPDEDGSTVKAAAARALGMMSAPGTAAALVTELAEPGDWSAPRIAEVLVELGEMSLKPCLIGLEHESANVRAWCCRVLGQLGDRSAVHLLGGRLLDRSGAVRTVAAEALGLLGDMRSTSSLVDAMLRDPAAQVRASAARALGRTGDPASLSALVDALNDADPWTRIRSVDALEALHPEEPELLLQAVRSGRKESARAAALALERTGHVQKWVEQLDDGPAGGVTVLEERLVLVARLGGSGPLRQAMGSSVDLRVRARSARLLGRSADPDSLEDLARACGDAEWPVRLEAVRAWVKTAPDGVPPAPLLTGLDDGEEMVRIAALDGLALRGDVGKVDPARLPELAGQSNLEARSAALHLVRGSGSDVERSVAMLLRHDPSDTLRAAATGALGFLCVGSEDPAFQVLIDALADTAEDVRATAAHALGRLPDGAGSQALVRATLDAGPKLREEITSILAARGLDSLHDELDTFMASDRVEARLAVLWTLGKVGDARGVPLLVAALEDPRARIRASAVGALGKIDATLVIPPLLVALKDPDARTRAAVTNALGRVHGPVAAHIRMALDDPDAFVRGRACIALGRVGDKLARVRLERALQENDPVPALIGLSLLGGTESTTAVAGLMRGPLISRLEDSLAQEDAEIRSRVRSFLGIAEPGIDRLTWTSDLRRTLASSRDGAERLRSLELLASFDLPDLLGRLGSVIVADPDPRLRVKAVRLLAAHSTLGDPALVRGLNDPDVRVRLAALQAGTRLGPSVGREVLACANGTEEVDRAAAQALAELFRAEPMELADLLMGTILEAERAVAIRALGWVGARTMVPLLTAFLEDDSTLIRVHAVEALEALLHAGASEAIESLETASRGPDTSVRGAALEALARFGEGSDDQLDEALRAEPDSEVRVAIVDSLADRSDETAIALLERSMRDPHPGVRQSSMLAALANPHAQGLDAFLRVLEDADAVEAQSLRTEVLNVGVITGLRHALMDGTLPLRVLSVRVLASLDASRFEQAFISAASDPAPPVRLAALAALVLCDSESAWTAVIRAARDEDKGVATRARAAVATGK